MTSDIARKVPIMAELAAENKTPEFLFWVGSACSFDERAKKISRAFAKILLYCNIDFAILGSEESDSGDVARRVGNEFLFQMQALHNIETFNMYKVKKIVTCCPHDFNTFKNEYPDFGSSYEVYHHSEFINMLIHSGKLKIENSLLQGKKITYHDPCYLGRGNGIYDSPRFILSKVTPKLTEMTRTRGRSLCCGAGGGQMFKEPEKGNMEIYSLRTKDILEAGPDIVATACPFCMTMLSDGIKLEGKSDQIKIYDLAELITMSLNI
jgi:heterodisulfide reductase subunit D